MRIAILLSTFDGAAHLGAQLESIAEQTHVDWTLFWRDDGSADDTVARLGAWACGRRQVSRVRDQAGRLGVLGSFFALLRAALDDPDVDAVAFADQDDYWLPYKLARAAAGLGDDAAPALYCARQFLVDATLRPIAPSAPVPRAPGFPDALTQNIATGCTVAMNRAAAELVAGSAPPPGTLHDWWSYLLVSASGGRVVFDDAPVVLYRQHAANAVGAPSSVGRRAVAAVRRGPTAFMALFRAHVLSLMAHGDRLTPEARAHLGSVSAALSRGSVARGLALRTLPMRRQTTAETAMFRLWFMIG